MKRIVLTLIVLLLVGCNTSTSPDFYEQMALKAANLSSVYIESDNGFLLEVEGVVICDGVKTWDYVNEKGTVLALSGSSAIKIFKHGTLVDSGTEFTYTLD